MSVKTLKSIESNLHYCMYSRTPVTRTLKGNEKLFELAGFRVIGVDLNIQFSRLIIISLLIFSTSVYDTVQIKLISYFHEKLIHFKQL